jgi:hypothetical protein
MVNASAVPQTPTNCLSDAGLVIIAGANCLSQHAPELISLEFKF